MPGERVKVTYNHWPRPIVRIGRIARKRDWYGDDLYMVRYDSGIEVRVRVECIERYRDDIPPAGSKEWAEAVESAAFVQ